MAEEPEDSGPNRIMVFLRIRPAKRGEIDPANGTHFLLDLQPDNKTCLLDSKTYNYDWIFNGEVDQELIYFKVAHPVIQNVFKGFWGTCMVYGQTGTGKSFTMCNFTPGNMGIIPRAMKAIFDTIETDTERKYTVMFSFIQIYLDKLGDLFNPEGPELKINRDKNGVSFPGVVEHEVKDQPDFQRLYEDGNQYRVITATKMNPESSRGHAALFIQIKSIPRDDPSGEERNGKLFLIDLAGYERFSKTGVQEGQMAMEAKTINASLLSLGNVVQALSDRSEHIPWRNAKLTRMLEDAIGGRAKCSIILTAGPSSDHMHETLGTLYFGSRAMAIKTNAKLAVNVDYKKLSAKLQEMLTAAEGRINILEVEATRRQLEREEAEAAYQAEWARIKKRQDDQLNELLQGGASKDKIEELIRANQEENTLMEEQQHEQRQSMEERHEQEVMESMAKQQEQLQVQSSESSANMSKDILELQRQLSFERQEKEKYMSRAKEAESEARRSAMEMNETRVMMEGDSLASFAAGGGGGGSAPGSAEVKKEFQRRIETVKSMYEENMQLRLSEMEEIHQEEVQKYKKLYEDLKATMASEVQAQRDELVTTYEDEINRIRRSSADIQDKLKKNHMVIKQSYQDQRDTLAQENGELNAYVELLSKQIESLGGKPAKRVENAGGAAKPLPLAGDASKRVHDLTTMVNDLKAELAYANAEREAFAKEKKDAAKSKLEDDKLNPVQIRQIRIENEELKLVKKNLEAEVFKMKSEQALTGQSLVDDDEDDRNEEILGDNEGVQAFTTNIMKLPFFTGAKPIQNTHENILSTLTTDLDEYRRMLKYKLVFVGAPGSGKSSAVKCFQAGSAPLIKAAPDVVTPTPHPYSSQIHVDDTFTSKTDWHKSYVQFLDIDAPQQQQSGGFLGLMKGSSKQTVADPAKVYLDLMDMPGDPAFWRAIPPSFLPSKNVIYCLTYDLTQPIETVKAQLESQLTLLHAACTRGYSKEIGGDAPKIGFCLVGTHRDCLKDSREASVAVHINRIAVILGDIFYRLRGEDTYGLVCVGNFAISAKDWTIVGTKKDRNPKTFKELCGFLGTIASQLYPNRPSAFVPSTKDTASHLTYMLGDELMESSTEKTAHLVQGQQRVRKGIVTLLTGLLREQKVRWAMDEKELRERISEHLDLKTTDSYGLFCQNYVIRELFTRGVITELPAALLEPKYLPRVSGKSPFSYNGVVVLDPVRLLISFSTFMCPTTLTRVPTGASVLKDKETMLMDYAALSRCQTTWNQGIITSDITSVVAAKSLPLVGNDVKLMQEIFCVMGLGLSLKSEVAILSPAHFSARISDCASYYISYMVGCNGDGVARKYKFNALPPTLFSRLQTRLIPFSHVPSKEPRHLALNWSDASYLVLEKARLKYGIFGSKVLKEATTATSVPVRGFMKVEGGFLYVAVTARTENTSAAVTASSTLLESIHYEITALCKREFRGAKVQFQDITLTHAAQKREHFQEGVETILMRHSVDEKVVQMQQQITLSLSDPKAKEMEDAIVALPQKVREK